LIEPAIPPEDAARVAALRDLGILDTPAEERFDRLTRLARRILGVPMAMISLVDADRQWYKSSPGSEVQQTPRRVSFCGHAILGDETFVVADARTDSRFADNPLVTGEPGVRFYAGQPLKAPGGERVGTLCVVDNRPREMAPEDIESLKDLAALAERELALAELGQEQLKLAAERDVLKEQALVDPLTRLWNRRAIDELLNREMVRAIRETRPLSVMMADLDRFKDVNDTHGHAAGDSVLRATAGRLRSSVRPQDAVGRYGGEEFLVVLPGTAAPAAGEIAERIRAAVASAPVESAGRAIPVTVSIGTATLVASRPLDAAGLIAAADRALYEAKKKGRNRVEREG
jgi:diguanylate cyclase (GGDEF)-like protein